MDCPYCGTNNDDEADFCNKCGKPLKTVIKENMTSSTKILLIAILVLVLAIGLTAGMVISKNMDTPTINNTSINESTQQKNITTTETQNNNDKENIKISASEAESIASDAMSGYEVYGEGAKLIYDENNRPIWKVSLYTYDKGTPAEHGQSAGYGYVDAITGEFLQE